MTAGFHPPRWATRSWPGWRQAEPGCNLGRRHLQCAARAVPRMWIVQHATRSRTEILAAICPAQTWRVKVGDRKQTPTDRTRPVNPSNKGVLLALAAFRQYSPRMNAKSIKYLGGSYSPFQIVFFSVLFGFPVVTFLLMRDHGARAPAPGASLLDDAAERPRPSSLAVRRSTPSPRCRWRRSTPSFSPRRSYHVLAIPLLGERVGIQARGWRCWSGSAGCSWCCNREQRS